MALGGTAINDEAGLETEADRMGARALARSDPLPSRDGMADLRPTGGAPPQLARAAVAQRQLDKTRIDAAPAGFGAIVALADTYNANLRKKQPATQLNELEAVHVAVLQALEGIHSSDLHASREGRWLKSMLGAIQTEHERLIAKSLAKNGPDPPIANFHALSRSDQTYARNAWTRLTQGTGNIGITEDETTSGAAPKTRPHAGFRVSVLSQFARLLKTGTGRDIVRQVERGGKALTIKPGLAANKDGFPSSEFAAAPTDMSGNDKLAEFDVKPELAKFKGTAFAARKRQAYLDKFVPLRLKDIADPKARAAAIYPARQDNPGKLGISMGGKYYKFGSGTAVDVTITTDVRDDADHQGARFVDDAREEIPVPNFITLGHELGHAAHMMQGTTLNEANLSDELLGKVGVSGAEVLNWSNMEEYANINAVENRLRADYGLRARFGHINQPHVQSKRLDPVATALDNLRKLIPDARQDSVKDPLDDAFNALGALKIADVRANLIAAATAFNNDLATNFPGFTQDERNQIKRKVRRFMHLVRSADEAELKDATAAADQTRVLTSAAKNRVAAAALRAAPIAPAPKKSSGFWSWFGY
jgi:hypothetical protein